jgi:hypothetical protein
LKTLTQTIIIFLCFQIKAQNVGLGWAKQMLESGGSGVGYSTIAYGNGNVYTVGAFNGVIDLDPGPGVYTLSSQGGSGAYLSKLNSNGNFVWGCNLAQGTSTAVGLSVTIDGSGNLLITGYFYGSGDFDPGNGILNLTSFGLGDIFISKINPAGNFLWAKQMGGVSDDFPTSITTDASGNVFTTGLFYGTTDFDPSPATQTLTSFGSADIFISKLDANGNFVLAKQMGGSSYDGGNSIAIDGTGNIYTAGFFYGVADFDPGINTYTLNAQFPSSFGGDVFISKLDANGNFIYAKQIGGPNDDSALGIKIDGNGDLLTTGRFNGANVDFDPGPGTYTLSGASYFDNAFVCKLSAAGNFLWAGRFSGPQGDCHGHSIAIDNLNNVYTTGYFIGAGVDFDPGPGSYQFNAIQRDMYISKLNPSGNFLWAKQMGGAGITEGWGIAFDILNNIYSTGYFSGTSDFDPSFFIDTLNASPGSNAFVLKLSICSGSQSLFNTTGLNALNICIGDSTQLHVSSNAMWSSGSAVNNTLSLGSSFYTSTLTTGIYSYYAQTSQTCPALPLAITVTVNALPTLTISGAYSVCIGSASSLSVSGASTYTWNTGMISSTLPISPTVITTYSVLGKDLNGCLDTASWTVPVNPIPTLSIVSSNSILCAGETATLEASGAVSYSWNTGGQIRKIQIIPFLTTTYTVTAWDGNGCSAEQSYTQLVDACVGEKSYTLNNFDFKIYPNPNSGEFTIHISSASENTEIEICNSLGALIYGSKISEVSTPVILDAIPAGIYIIKIVENNRVLNIQKFVKK